MKLSPQRKRLILFGGATLLIVAIYVYARRTSKPTSTTTDTSGADTSGVDASGGGGGGGAPAAPAPLDNSSVLGYPDVGAITAIDAGSVFADPAAPVLAAAPIDQTTSNGAPAPTATTTEPPPATTTEPPPTGTTTTEPPPPGWPASTPVVEQVLPAGAIAQPGRAYFAPEPTVVELASVTTPTSTSTVPIATPGNGGANVAGSSAPPTAAQPKPMPGHTVLD